MIMESGDWPHQFIKEGKEELETRYDDGNPYYVKHVKMRCIHCKQTVQLPEQSIPNGKCPKRTDKVELSRLKR